MLSGDVTVECDLGDVDVVITITLLCVLPMFRAPIVINQGCQLTDAPDRPVDARMPEPIRGPSLLLTCLVVTGLDVTAAHPH